MKRALVALEVSTAAVSPRTVEDLDKLAAERGLWMRWETPSAPGTGYRVTFFTYGPARPHLASMDYTEVDGDPGKLIREAAAWLEGKRPP